MVKTLGFEPRNGGSIPPPASIYLRGDFMRNKFISLLLVVAVALALCVPAFAAYGTTPTYATGNYQYSYSTSSTGSADFFTALMAQLRYIYSNLNTVNTWLKSCSTYLGGISTDVNSIKLDAISIKTNTSSAATTLTNIKSDTGSIKTDVDTIESRLVTQGTTLSNIYSSVVAAATEKTQSAILTAVKSISTDGLATEKTLASADSRLATLNNKVATAQNQVALLNLFNSGFEVLDWAGDDHEYFVDSSDSDASFSAAFNGSQTSILKALADIANVVASPDDKIFDSDMKSDDDKTALTDLKGTYGDSDALYAGMAFGSLRDGLSYMSSSDSISALSSFFSGSNKDSFEWFSDTTYNNMYSDSGSASSRARRAPASDDTYWVIDPSLTAESFLDSLRGD